MNANIRYDVENTVVYKGYLIDFSKNYKFKVSVYSHDCYFEGDFSHIIEAKAYINLLIRLVATI